MPLAPFERKVLRLLAENRNPDSFVGGATVLHQSPSSIRQSRDIDLFHDTPSSVSRSAEADCITLRKNGYDIKIVVQQPSFQRAEVKMGSEQTLVEWVFDSAFRFFPVERDTELGYRLNFWDAATNKILALAGRNEFRDYVDVIWLDEQHLSLGALAWAAAGKDAGLTPDFLLEEMQRNSRFSNAELNQLDLAKPVDPVALKQQWIRALGNAKRLIIQLPPEDLGCLYLDKTRTPITPNPCDGGFTKLTRHYGSIRGALPRISE